MLEGALCVNLMSAGEWGVSQNLILTIKNLAYEAAVILLGMPGSGLSSC
jgi:hypothetical protein